MGRLKAMLLGLGACLVSLPALALPVLSLTTTQTGDALQVEVLGTGMDDLYAYQFSLNFDPAVLQVSSVTEGPFLSTAGPTFFDGGTADNMTGLLSFVFDTLLGPAPGATGDGVLAVIDFQIEQLQVFTSLTFSDVLALDSQLSDLGAQGQDTRLYTPEPGVLALLLVGIALLAFTTGRSASRRPPGAAFAA
jgi:hypothetical protein